MREYLKFYIDGQWVDPIEMKTVETINPATEAGFRQDRARLCCRRRQGSQGRPQGFRELVADESRGAARSPRAHPRRISEARRRPGCGGDGRDGRADSARQWLPGRARLGHLTTAIEVLKNFKFEEQRGGHVDRARSRSASAALITPWNWPINQITVKVFPALATGCTMVLKPSQESHFSGQILAEIIACRGRSGRRIQPDPGQGLGRRWAMLSSHPDIDMISIHRLGVAPGSKSQKAPPTPSSASARSWAARAPNIVLDDADLAKNVGEGRRRHDGQLRSDL